MTADLVRRAVRVTAADLRPGDRITRWADHFRAHRAVIAVTPSERDTVLVTYADHTVERHHRWTPFHAANRRPNLPERNHP